MGGIKRLNVAVVVNNMPVTDKAGKVTYRPLTAAEKQQINDLAMQAMGFSKERGDSLTVVNSSFAGEPVEIVPEVPMWKKPETVEYGKDALRFIVGVVVLLILYKRALKPILDKLMAATPRMLDAPATQEAIANKGDEQTVFTASASLQNLGAVRQMAKENPRMVASVVSTWTAGN